MQTECRNWVRTDCKEVELIGDGVAFLQGTPPGVRIERHCQGRGQSTDKYRGSSKSDVTSTRKVTKFPNYFKEKF